MLTTAVSAEVTPRFTDSLAPAMILAPTALAAGFGVLQSLTPIPVRNFTAELKQQTI